MKKENMLCCAVPLAFGGVAFPFPFPFAGSFRARFCGEPPAARGVSGLGAGRVVTGVRLHPARAARDKGSLRTAPRPRRRRRGLRVSIVCLVVRLLHPLLLGAWTRGDKGVRGIEAAGAGAQRVRM